MATRVGSAGMHVHGADPFPVSLVAHGRVGEAEEAYVRKKVLSVGKLAPMPILFARVKLTRLPHRSVERPALVEATFDVNGRMVRAHVAARDLREAADLLEQRLHRKLAGLADRLHERRTATGTADRGELR